MLKKIVQEELENIKWQLKNLRRKIHEGTCKSGGV